MSSLKAIAWTDPYGLAAKAQSFLYFIRVVDGEGYEFRYVGQTKCGRTRLLQYAQNINRIFNGLPRRPTPGQETYRAVHLALAKACEHGWEYEFYPIEEVAPDRIGKVEQQRIGELRCNLNGARKWHVGDFPSLAVSDLIVRDVAESSKYQKGDWTVIQTRAARAALQRDAETLLGRFLFAFARLESALDLCLVWVSEGKDLDQRTIDIEKQNFSKKLELLFADAQRSACEDSVRLYGKWLESAQTVRKRRNILVHGRLAVDVRYDGLTVTLSRATSTAPSSVHFNLKDLQRLIAECESLMHKLSDLRISHPL